MGFKKTPRVDAAIMNITTLKNKVAIGITGKCSDSRPYYWLGFYLVPNTL